ncbi:MAG TPA: hypothetical protein VFH50_12515 [Acidimicrobiales bacterium]|nr:hypothetical protein [Acidimicrobiales bacterium]
MSEPRPDPGSAAEIEAVVRRYLARVARRYVPAAVLLGTLLLIVALVPTVSPSAQPTGTGNAAVGGAGQRGGAGTAAGGAGPGSLGTTPGAGGPAGAPLDGGSGAPTGAGGSGGAPAPAVPAAVAPGAAGVTRTGINCAPGVRQFTWSRYAPICVPAFHGSNGGATGQGVTGTTITLSYRLPNSAQQQAINALAGAANISDSAYVSDLQSYINFFNTQFELYGRKVVLKTYNGQGDYINEDQGQDLAAAQADAVTARELGAFGDVTFFLEASAAYEQDLASQRVVSFSPVAEPHSWYQQYAPYEYSVVGPDGSVGIDESAAVVCRRLAGMHAIFSGNTGDTLRNRAFGALYPENPEYTNEVRQYEQDVGAQCGLTMHPVVAYSVNIAEYETQAAQAVAQMKANGVTTMLCACDPIFPILLTNAQQQQGYYPEIFTFSFGDPVSRDYNQTAWSHTVAGGVQFPPLSTTEAYKAFQVGYPGRHPAEWPGASPPYFYVPYYTLLQVFDALQAAGPDLNATTFERGMFSLPASQPGDVVGGQWVPGNQVFDPVTSFSLVWWNPNAVSDFDRTKGAYQSCNGGAVYDVRNLAALGDPHQQLSCFGR